MNTVILYTGSKDILLLAALSFSIMPLIYPQDIEQISLETRLQENLMY